jgi:hypothetical protein
LIHTHCCICSPSQELQSPVFESALFAALLYGHLKISMLLLDEGAEYKALVELQSLYPHQTSTTLSDYSNSMKSSLATKIGDGNAQDQVSTSDYPVISVAWYTTALPGAVGYLGGKHSVLVLLASLPDAQHREKYFLEKAQVHCCCASLLHPTPHSPVHPPHRHRIVSRME